MSAEPTHPILSNIRRALGRDRLLAQAPRPMVLPPRLAGDLDLEIDLLLNEINALSGIARRMPASELDSAIRGLVQSQQVAKATLWPTAGLAGLRFAERLQRFGVEVIPSTAGKYGLAQCDLGVTEVDYALPETGTLGLLSSVEKPRAVSLLPRIHLAILRPEALCADLHQVFAQAKNHNYLVFITGPSRTADIELTVTLGVHGPRSLIVWCLS